MADAETLTRWRREFQDLHDTLMRGREEFDAWFEETAMLIAGNSNCMTDLLGFYSTLLDCFPDALATHTQVSGSLTQAE